MTNTEMMNKDRKEFEDKMFIIPQFIAGIAVTILTINLFWGSIAAYDKFDVTAFLTSTIFGLISVMFWINIAFGKLAVYPNRIVIRAPIMRRKFEFEKIENVKIKGKRIKIKLKGFGLLLNVGSIKIKNPEDFVKCIQRYIPDKLDLIT